MRASTILRISRHVRPLRGCLGIFTALALISVPIVRPIVASSLQEDTEQVPSATFPGTGVGAIPDGLGVPGTFGAPLVISFAVSQVSGAVTNVSVNVTLTHPNAGDVDMVLRAPGGVASQVLVSRIGATTATGVGSTSDFAGAYNFADGAVSPNIWTAAGANPIPLGTYRTTAAGGAGQVNPPPVTNLTSPFSGLGAGASGTWTLSIRDAAAGSTGSVTAANLTVNPTFNLSFQKPPLDFDGDGKTDSAVVRDAGGNLNWYVQRSTAGFLAAPFGATAFNDTLVPADYDGDLKWDIAVWRPGSPSNFFILQSSNVTLRVVPFGINGDEPRITQDFDADGLADPAVVRNVGGTLTWYILRSALGFTAVSFGSNASDVSIRGDYDGDGKADVAVYRFTTLTFYVLRSSDGGVQAATFGVSGNDYRLPADFDGDGKTDYTVWRGVGVGSPGTWFWLRSSDGGFRALNFGVGGVDLPVPGDYDGDGITDQATWRPGTPANFFVNRSTAGFLSLPFGTTGDIALGSQLQAR